MELSGGGSYISGGFSIHSMCNESRGRGVKAGRGNYLVQFNTYLLCA